MPAILVMPLYRGNTVLISIQASCVQWRLPPLIHLCVHAIHGEHHQLQERLLLLLGGGSLHRGTLSQPGLGRTTTRLMMYIPCEAPIHSML